MAVLASDLKQPSGHIPTSWFDDTDLEVWIDEGEALVTELETTAEQDAATKAWAYYRAYDRKAQEKEDLPQSRSVDGVAQLSYGTTRSQLWQTRAAHWLAMFNDLIDTTADNIPTFFTRATGRRGL